MNPEEYAKLARVDRDHWYYRGKRAIVRHWIDRHHPLAADDLLIDAGIGAGTWAAEMGRVCRVCGVDGERTSLALAAPTLATVGGRVVQAKLPELPFADGVAAVVTALDVLEHVADDRAGVRELVRVARPGGLVVVTVPALGALWSDWDVALHHHRRYARRELLAALAGHGARVLRCAYLNALLLPAIGLVRIARGLVPTRRASRRLEDVLPPAPINRLLFELMVRPACWGWCSPPIGVSLIAVLRKDATPTLGSSGVRA